MTTEELVDKHLNSFGLGIDALMQDYDDNSVIISPQGTFKGTAQIRQFFDGFVASVPPGFMEALKITKKETAGNVGYLTWEALPWFPLGTDTFVFNNGKVAYQTFAAYAAQSQGS